MKTKSIKVYGPEDEDFIANLRSIGVDRKVASVLAYFRNEEKATSRSIEMASGLRQPEVSIAIRQLRNKGWITTLPTASKGRRAQDEYSLNGVTVKDIVDSFWADIQKSMDEKAKLYQQLTE